MTCFVHKRTKEKYNLNYEELCNEKLKCYEGASDNLIMNLRDYWYSGPWRYNDIYGFVEIKYDGGNRILGIRYYRYRNKKGLPRRISGIYLSPGYSYSQSWIGIPAGRPNTNDEIIKAIKSVLKQEEKFFKKKRKYLEYSELIIENTNWLNIINPRSEKK